ncbi:hypothetical protein TWF694_003646 [Orbilia ellipsospora]|uniref:Uncharacterized protein n=1 Tax=Orbilia ellipsospora TaxID=2528407 RepID=A0AAV9WZZ5_9PEZI
MFSSFSRRASSVIFHEFECSGRSFAPPLLSRRIIPCRQIHNIPQTLKENPNIHIHQNPDSKTYSLSFSSTPKSPSQPLGTTTTIPPTPQTFTENPKFRQILMKVVSSHAVNDPEIIFEAYGTWGAAMGVKQTMDKSLRRDRKLHTDFAGTPSHTSSDTVKEEEGGKGEGGDTTPIGGFHHVVDRRTPYYGGMRIPESQDILGSLQVDGTGKLLGGFVECESYRIVSGDGVMKLTEYLEGKLREELEREE